MIELRTVVAETNAGWVAKVVAHIDGQRYPLKAAPLRATTERDARIEATAHVDNVAVLIERWLLRLPQA